MGTILKGKSAVVTGSGSSGIGRAVALAMAGEGASVVVNDIGRDSTGSAFADSVVAEIRKNKGSAVANYDNVADMAGGANIIKTALDSFGKIDILVNCAGTFRVMPTSDMTENDWDSIMAVNLKGHFTCTKAAISVMAKQGSGRIINFSSRGAFHGPPTPMPEYSCLAYNTAKAGILGFTVALAAELKDRGITVNAILPSAITSLFPGKKNQLTDNIPVPKRTDPEFVAPVVVYLVSDLAANVTGQFIYSCGGDICLYGKPLQLPGPHMFARKQEKWSVDELHQIISSMIK